MMARMASSTNTTVPSIPILLRRKRRNSSPRRLSLFSTASTSCGVGSTPVAIGGAVDRSVCCVVTASPPRLRSPASSAHPHSGVESDDEDLRQYGAEEERHRGERRDRDHPVDVILG